MLSTRKKILFALACLLLIFTFAAPDANAKGNEYKTIVKHLKTKYKAKKVSIPMMWLARFAVRVIRPAGVQSFSLTVFENLQFTNRTLDAEMQSMLKNSFGKEWSPVFRVRSRGGQQAYMYMSESGTSVKMTLVTIDKNQAAVIRAKFKPEKFAEFLDNPKIFGISIDGGNQKTVEKTAAPPEISAAQKSEESDKPE